jgi:hypothetical protein
VPKVAPDAPASLKSDSSSLAKPDKIKVKAKVKKKEIKIREKSSVQAAEDDGEPSVSTPVKMEEKVPTGREKPLFKESLKSGGRRRNLSKRNLFRCSYCDYASVRRYNTERHIRLRHPFYRYKVSVKTVVLQSERAYYMYLRGSHSHAYSHTHAHTLACIDFGLGERFRCCLTGATIQV